MQATINNNLRVWRQFWLVGLAEIGRSTVNLVPHWQRDGLRKPTGRHYVLDLIRCAYAESSAIIRGLANQGLTSYSLIPQSDAE